MIFDIIVSYSKNRVIGRNNNLPWALSKDLSYFRKITQETSNDLPNIVIMGYKTWLSIPKKFRPLTKRINIVISNKNYSKLPESDDMFFKVSNVNQIPELLKNDLNNRYNNIFIIGGESIYKYYITHPGLKNIYATYINDVIEGDNYFPILMNYYRPFLLKSVSENIEEDGFQYNFRVYRHLSDKSPLANNTPFGEYQYLDLIKNILEKGKLRDNRTNYKAKSIFGYQMRYNLKEGFPLLTTKKMYTKGVIEELLWFLRGSTDANILKQKGVHIWDGNSSREYLDSIGLLKNKEGDCGPIYGFNFRHFGAEYVDCETSYDGLGYDQIKECLRLITEDPSSRRIVINLWNPNILGQSCLPPCHVLYQFFVDDGSLSCSMYQRSGDVGLGIPFNIASASLLTHIFAKLSNLEVGEFIHTIGDAHIYENHFSQLRDQVNRDPYPFPILKIEDRGQKQVEDFNSTDFKFLGYDYHPSIKMEMAA